MPKSQYDKMMEELEAQGKVKHIDPKVSNEIRESLRKALEDYREKAARNGMFDDDDDDAPILNI